mmetsp:Transcript_23637/g.21002  ORF Transcript_23637/g.21002 Transcript_23637/m.21002 type:complete len:292 (+) Transcript_23637:568-1443(+)
MMSQYSKAGKTYIPYSKQPLPRLSKISKLSTNKIFIPKSNFNSRLKFGRNSTGIISTIPHTTAKFQEDNIDKLQKSCSRLKLLKLFDHKAKEHLERDDPKRMRLNIKLKELFIKPADRFSSNPPQKSSGYVHDYQKENERFPPNVNVLNRNRKSYFEPTPLYKVEINDNAIRGSRNTNFKMKKDKFYYKCKDSSLPRYLLCNGERNELDLINNEKSLKENNHENSKFYVNPIGRINKKEKMQKISEKNDVRNLLFQEGYIKTFQDVKSPVKEYRNKGKKTFESILGYLKQK